MQNRGNRRRRKALISKHLIASAIREYNREVFGYRYDGTFDGYAHHASELPKEGYYSLRAILKNKGRDRFRCYDCGGDFLCEWCVGNRIHKHHKRFAILTADMTHWKAGDYECLADEVTEAVEGNRESLGIPEGLTVAISQILRAGQADHL